MATDKRDFDREAASWDEHPARIKLAKDVARAISEHVPLTPHMNVMDFGCGTGLLAIELLPRVLSVTGIDSSAGMLEVLRRKIADWNLPNLPAMLFDADRGDILAGAFDLVVSSMTLHHVRDLEPLFAQFFDVLTPGGSLAIADLDPDDGRFHEDRTGVFHCGFDRGMLRAVFASAGFEQVRDADAAEVVKPSADGELRPFSVFLMTGRKPLA
ncbi:MAG: class I SAM-dependent methyltransferase [Patescibacteria group bacterium]|nr:class I SAM-dependent methyltransferase [Patescibacteria group bacterium]